MCNDNLLFSNDLTQNTPCNERRDFLEHVFRRSHDHAWQFEVVLESLKQPGPSLTVQLTNEPNETYFSGAGWIQFVQEYEMKVGEKVIFILDWAHRTIYYEYKDPAISDDSAGDDDEFWV